MRNLVGKMFTLFIMDLNSYSRILWNLEFFFFFLSIFADIDDFIVDDDGQPITKKKGKKFSGYTDA